jgi:hypothetical protein
MAVMGEEKENEACLPNDLKPETVSDVRYMREVYHGGGLPPHH